MQQADVANCRGMVLVTYLRPQNDSQLSATIYDNASENLIIWCDGFLLCMMRVFRCDETSPAKGVLVTCRLDRLIHYRAPWRAYGAIANPSLNVAR